MIVLDPNDPNLGEAGITNNELTIKKNFYDREVRITYRRDVNKLFIDEDGKPVELPQSQQLIADAPPKSAWDLISPTAFAQGQFQSAPFVSSLESPDPIIRRNARADLARQLSNRLAPLLVTDNLDTVARELEMPLIPVLVAIERRVR